MIKWYSSSWETYLKATKHHLPYGITQCCLIHDTGEHAKYYRSQTSLNSSLTRAGETEMIYISTDSHQSN